MENKIKGITDGLQKMADISIATVKSSIENTSKNISELTKVMTGMGIRPFVIPFASVLPFVKKDSHGCCPPEEDCPPHCLTRISRNAFAGERITVPFMVRNTCNSSRHYRIGARELKNIDGSPAPSQPILNKKEVTLNAGESEMVLMTIDLGQFSSGQIYDAEIVIREKDINQNICFRLTVDGYSNIPVADPLDEKKYLMHWQSWQSHFYCEPVKARINQ